MTIDYIKALMAADESRTLELKKTTGELKDGMHSACAFLNIDNHHTHTNLNYNANTTIYSVAIGNKSHCGNFGFVGTICHRA